MKRLYLILTIVGVIAPYVFFIQFFSIEGISLNGFVSAIFINNAVGGMTADLLITSIIFWVFIIYCRRNAMDLIPCFSSH